MADEHAAVSATATESRAMTAPPPGSGLPAQVGTPGVPAAHPAHGGPPAAKAPAPKRSGRLRRVLVPVLILAALGYGGKTAYDYFVEGRFLVSTDDAYVGASTSIIAAKAMGHLTAVPVVDNQVVHQGDLLASIDDGDYQNAVDAAKARIATQDATIARFGRQIDAQGAIIAQAEAQIEASQAQLKGAAGRRRARLARIRPFAEARPDQFRLAAAARAGDRRPRPHRRRRSLPPGRPPLRPSPRSTAPGPISTSSRRSATKRPGSAANSTPRSPRRSATFRSPGCSRRSTASSATRRPRSETSCSRGRA